MFTFRDHPVDRMLSSAWKRARKKTGLDHVRVHDLKHTFGVRLSAAGVSFENRQVLLGHKINKITEHYSPADVRNLLIAANKVCAQREHAPTIIRRKQVSSCKIPNPEINKRVADWLKAL